FEVFDPQHVVLTNLQNITLGFNLPTNASVDNLALVPDTSMGLTGNVAVAIDSSFTPARMVLSVQTVPKNPIGPNQETPFRFPAIDITMTATGGEGARIVNRVAGTDYDTAGYQFQSVTNLAIAT